MRRPLLAALLALLAGGSVAAQGPSRAVLTGFVDRTGAVVRPAEYDSGSTSFRGDWVAVSKGGKSGYLNLRTGATTGLVFDQVADDYTRVLFADGPEPAMRDGKWGYVDRAGVMVILPQFDGARGFDPDGLAVVEMAAPGGYPRRQGFIDRAGRIVVEPRYDALWHYSGGMAVFRLGDRSGALDREGRVAILPRFGFLGWFGDNGLAPATLEGRIGKDGSRYGYVDRAGRFVVPEQFGWAGSFKPMAADGGQDAPPGLARVVLASGEVAYVDAKGTIVTRFASGVTASGIGANGLVRFQDRKTAKYGFADRSGAIVIPARFEQAGGFDERGIAAAQENGRAGYIRADGGWAIAPRFSTAGSFDEHGQAQASEGDRSVLIDRTGKVVATLTHRESFYWQASDYAAFRVYPPRYDYPIQMFGAWRLDRTLYAVPEVPSLWPTPTGSIRLTFRTDDGLVRWRVSTEGWTLDLSAEQGPEKDPDVSGSTKLDALPATADALLASLRRQLGGAAFSVAMTPPAAADRSAQSQRLQAVARNKAAYLAALSASAPDLDRALQAMRTAIADQFGKLSGAPCMPPQCVY